MQSLQAGKSLSMPVCRAKIEDITISNSNSLWSSQRLECDHKVTREHLFAKAKLLFFKKNSTPVQKIRKSKQRAIAMHRDSLDLMKAPTARTANRIIMLHRDSLELAMIPPELRRRQARIPRAAASRVGYFFSSLIQRAESDIPIDSEQDFHLKI